MKRPSSFLISLFASLITSTLLLSATAASAQTGGNFYVAKPVTAAADTRVIVRETLWKSTADGSLLAAKGNARASIVCESLVKKVGAVSAFRAGADAFDGESLAKCNAKAKGGTTAIARN